MSDSPTPSTCRGCGAPTLIMRVLGGGCPIRAFNPTPLYGEIVSVPTSQTTEAYTEAGEPVTVSAAAAVDYGADACTYVPHLDTCPAEKKRKAAPKRPVQIVDAMPSMTGVCERCSSTVHWIDTVAGKKACVDVHPCRGVLLSRAAAGEAKERAPDRLVRGFRTNGEAVAVLLLHPEIGPLAGDEIVSVYVSHNASCTGMERNREAKQAS